MSISSVVTRGYGTWSTVNKLPTWGYGIRAAEIPVYTHIGTLIGASKRIGTLAGASESNGVLRGASERIGTLAGNHRQ